jgi:DNA invertase Pin-like site-specific DNA recombinase
MDRHPAAYLRRSFVDADSPGDISREAQRATVRKLAAADGHNGNLVEYDDWGISADVAKSAKRTAYTRLLADMEAGRVSAVYAFDADRLYRDPRDLIRLQDAATRHAVAITTTGGRLAIGEGDDPAAEGFAFITAVFGRMELQKAKKRVRAAMTARRARGDALGRPPYGWRFGRDEAGRVVLDLNPAEPIAPVLEAVREAEGSFSGAARLLNAAGVPACSAASWSGNTVGRIAHHADPETWPASRRPGRRSRHVWTLAGLLHCPCGGLMTARRNYVATRYGKFGPYVGYQCPRARFDATHPRPYIVAESVMLPLVKAETARLRAPEAVTVDAPDLEAARADLEARRARIVDMYELHDIERDDYQRRMAAVRDGLAGIERRAEAETIVPVPPAIDWGTWTPGELNRVLRALFDRIQLGADLRPLPYPDGFAWTMPEWRAIGGAS